MSSLNTNNNTAVLHIKMIQNMTLNSVKSNFDWLIFLNCVKSSFFILSGKLLKSLNLLMVEKRAFKLTLFWGIQILFCYHRLYHNVFTHNINSSSKVIKFTLSIRRPRAKKCQRYYFLEGHSKTWEKAMIFSLQWNT